MFKKFFNNQHIFYVSSLIVIVLIVYGEVLFFDFVWDDIPFIKENQLIRSFRYIPYVFSNGMPTIEAPIHYRPLMMISLMFDYFIWGYNPSGYHLTNLLLHLGSSILLYTLLLNFVDKKWQAFLPSLIFAVHPVHCDAVAWIMARGDILCGFFVILALLCYIKEKKFFSTMFFVLALISKEMAVTFPIIAFFYSWLNKNDKKDAFKWAVINVVILVIYLAVRANVLELPFGAKQPFALRFYTSITLIPRYFKMVFYPFKLSLLYYGLPVFDSLFSWHVILSAVLLITIILIAVVVRKKAPLVIFSIFFFFLSLLPVSGLPTLIDVAMVAERYLYMPMIAIAIFFSQLTTLFLKKGVSAKKVIISLTAMAVLLGWLTFDRKKLWENEFVFLKRMNEDAPNYHEAKAILAYIYIQKGDLDEAEKLLFQALKIKPDYAEGLNTLGTVYLRKGKYSIAQELFEKAIYFKPEHPEAHSNLAIVYAINKRYDDAEKEFKIAIRIKPNFLKAYLNLSRMYIIQGRLDEAESLLSRAKLIKEDGKELSEVINLLVQKRLNGRDNAMQNMRQ